MFRIARYGIAVAALISGALSAAAPAQSQPNQPNQQTQPQYVVGAAQQILAGGVVDSLPATVRGPHGKLLFIMSNASSEEFTQKPSGALMNPRIILRSGPKGSVDYCGVHPVGTIVKLTWKHWITFYHGEQADPYVNGGVCDRLPPYNQSTRWAVYKLQTFDAGLTWHKGGQVLGQDRQFVGWSANPQATANINRDDAGSPRLVVRSGYMYMFYRAVNQQSPDQQQMSVARASLRSTGAPGLWRKWYCSDPEDPTTCGFTQPGLGGMQTHVPGLVAEARGITWNTYLQSYVTVRAWSDGLWMQTSQGSNLLAWSPPVLVLPLGGSSGQWPHAVCDPSHPQPDYPMAAGYGATIGLDGSSTTTGSRFWVYYMLKPKGQCFSSRYLMRREVSLTGGL